ncbi:cysteinyl-tRNA synthetase [Linnemannia gamsii]|uniref:Adenylate cyclase n=1 Tax=Linnemannia gamsii TaxID=64522 RepID=A0ABQ7K9G1_9FUNG|nr:cysteinyl-tRNA synthetase [Linnemannia gamsii]
MSPGQPGHRGDRKGSTGSASTGRLDSSFTTDTNNSSATPSPMTEQHRRPSNSSGYFSPAYYNNGNTNTNGTHSPYVPRSPFNINNTSEERERPRPINGRSYHLDTPQQSSTSTYSTRRGKGSKDGSESSSSGNNGLLSFFRTSSSSSRPPSPDLLDTFYSNSHTRKTSFSSNNGSNSNSNNANSNLGNHRNVVLSSSAGSLLSNSSGVLNSNSNSNNNNNYNYSNGNGSYNGGSLSNIQQQHNSQNHNSPSHPFDAADADRRRSIESYSRSPSPDQLQQQQQLYLQQQHFQQSSGGNNRRQLYPATPPAPHIRPHQRTDSIKNDAMEAQHRRTKSTDSVEMYGKRQGPQDQDHPNHVVSPAKETKKILFNFFKKRALLHHGSSSSQQQQQQQQQQYQQQQQQQHQYQTYGDRSRKYSADDQYFTSPPAASNLTAFSMALFPDNDAHLNHHDRRHGSDTGEMQRALQYMPRGKKGSRGEQHIPGFVVDLNDMSGVKQDPKHNHWLPLTPAAGAEAWHAPESWGVQPPSSAVSGAQLSLALSPEDLTSEEMDPTDFENWEYGKKKPSTIRIFRPDTTYTTVNCVFSITASELSAILCKKIFKPDTSKYHLYVLRNGIVRPLSPQERPLNILRRCLLQFGYTDQDKLEELSGKDNSFICRITFAENAAPLTTEVDFPDNTNYADVNLEKRCLPTIPIFLYSRAKNIVRLNISYNQRMDLPLDFVQNCSVMRELRMAYNDLDRVPSNVRSIVYLQVLDLRGNRIKDLTKARLEDARELVTIFLQSNRLETIPDSFETFEHLRILNLSSNNMSKVPLVLFRILSLEELDLSFNEISEIPEEIGQLVRLRKLLLFGNRIGPYLPKSMSSLARLKKLDIRQNGILNLDAIDDLRSLEEIYVDFNTNVIFNNSFRSLARASFLKCNMTDVSVRGTSETLTYLDISSNKLSNLSPTLFEHLKSLEILKLDHNSISSIPATISLLNRLISLTVSNNMLSNLPESIGQMESLRILDVHCNNLSELPVAIWKCSLTTLNVSSNLLENFPDPPKMLAPPVLNALSASSSTATLCDPENAQNMIKSANSPTPSRSKPLPAPPVPLQNTPSGRAPYAPPLAHSLQTLCLGDNRLPDEVMFPLSHFLSITVLNISHNYITEIPRGKIPNMGLIIELYVSGNQLTSLPAEDIERLKNLRVLHVNGNKLTTLPAELGKINRLNVLDVGCNMLKYNIANWPYDWNWNWNLELKYLNMSGNKRLQIKRQTAEGVPTSSSRPGNLSEFGALTRLRILGLMDVTITDNVPENSVERRVRTSMSTLHNMSYGMADTLGVGENLRIWDLVHPKFQTKEDESLFGLFDGRPDKYRTSCVMTSHLKDRFGTCLRIELEKLKGTDTVVSALRRTFLGLDRDLWPYMQDDNSKAGASALVAYINGTTLYSANVGDAIAVLVKKSDTYTVISQKHIPWNPTEASRIKRSGGFVSENGRLNDELDISRSFGQYHLVPIVNSNPYIETTILSEDDDFLIMASNAFWDVMSYTTAVDIAKAAKRDYGDLMYASQKLRDIAISYGARDHMVVMLIGVGDLFNKKELSEVSEYQQPNYKRPKAPEGPSDTLKYLKPEIEPPQGDVAMVFTDIKNSTKLWEKIPIAMAIAIKEHFTVMRRQLRSIGGYEVKNEGDALMASFSSVPAAMLWCFKVQELLVNADWPQEVLATDEGQPIFNASDPVQPMYRGLSVRMGIHWGRPVSDRDAVTRRMDYYGPMVNRASRICDSADGGEICISSDVINVMQHLLVDPELEQSDSPNAEHVRELKKMGFRVIELGERKLKGLETLENLHLIYSGLLVGRLTMDPIKSMAGPILETQMVESTVILDAASVRALQLICLRLERLAAGTTAQHGRATEQSLTLLSLSIKDNADQNDLTLIAESYVTRIENAFSQLYMAKTGHFVNVFESLGRAIDTDPSYILRALQMYVGIMGGLDSPNLL